MVRVLCSIITAVLIFIQPGHCRAMEIVAVVSSRIPPYMEALAGFRDDCGRAVPTSGLKSITFATITELILSEEADFASLRTTIRTKKPDLILAVGTNALNAVKSFAKIPIIYLLVPYPEAVTGGLANISGIDMTIAPEVQLAAFLEQLPTIKRLGIVHDPSRSGDLVKKIRAAANRWGIELKVREAQSPRQVHNLLQSLIGEIDALWMVPDHTVTTAETVEEMLLFSLEQRVPVLSFTEKYVTRGATMAVVFDNYSMGEKAAAMAREMLADPGRAGVPAVSPARVKMLINYRVAEKLGLAILPDKDEKTGD